MSSPSTILTLPSISSAQVLAKHCIALGCIGVIDGTNGLGKTEALKFKPRAHRVPSGICWSPSKSGRPFTSAEWRWAWP
jgi:hypothetical protein